MTFQNEENSNDHTASSTFLCICSAPDEPGVLEPGNSADFYFENSRAEFKS